MNDETPRYTEAEVELQRQDDENESSSMQMLANVILWALLVAAFALLFYLVRHL